MTRKLKTNGTQELPWWYRQEPQKFMSSPDVEMMTCEEIGSYFLLLQKAWLLGENCTLPNDPARLAKLSRIDKVSDLVLSKFSLDKDGRLFNARLSMEWRDALKRSKDGKNAINARWEKEIRENNDRNTTVVPSKYDSDTKTEQNTTEQNRTSKTLINHVSSTESEVVSASPTTPTAPSEAAVRITAKLAGILGSNVKKPETLVKWTEQAQALVTAHGEKTVEAVMDFALADNPDGFWRGRVFAMKNFARCFKTMHAQQKRGVTGTRTAGNPLAERAASLKTGHDFSDMAKGDL